MNIALLDIEASTNLRDIQNVKKKIINNVKNSKNKINKDSDIMQKINSLLEEKIAQNNALENIYNHLINISEESKNVKNTIDTIKHDINTISNKQKIIIKDLKLLDI